MGLWSEVRVCFVRCSLGSCRHLSCWLKLRFGCQTSCISIWFVRAWLYYILFFPCWWSMADVISGWPGSSLPAPARRRMATQRGCPMTHKVNRWAGSGKLTRRMRRLKRHHCQAKLLWSTFLSSRSSCLSDSSRSPSASSSSRALLWSVLILLLRSWGWAY